MVALAPAFTLSDEGKKVRQLTEGLARLRMHIASGGQTGEKEAESYRLQQGLSWDASEANWKNGIRKVIADIKGTARKKFAAYKPEVVKLYKERGGFDLSDIDRTLGTGTKEAGKALLNDIKELNKTLEKYKK